MISWLEWDFVLFKCARQRMSGNTLCIRTAVDSRWRLEALRTVMGSLKLLLKRVVKN